MLRTRFSCHHRRSRRPLSSAPIWALSASVGLSAGCLRGSTQGELESGDDGVQLDSQGGSGQAGDDGALPDLSNDEGPSEDVGDGTGAEGPAEGEGGDSMCPDQTLAFTPQIPTVVLLLDQSSSMNASFDDTIRWDAVERALFDDTQGVVKALEDEIRFGMTLYSSENGNEGDVCPMLIEAAPALGNHVTLRDLYAGQSWIEDTPTGESIAATSAALADFDEPGQKIIVLATDGEPDTCAEPDPQNGQPEAVAAAAASHAADIDLFVISVGEEISRDHLQDLADAGVGRTGAPFYTATDSQAMIDAFRDIIDGVRSCIFDLEVELKLDKAHLGQVLVNGDELIFDDANGWRANNSGQIELLGTACEAIQSGDVEIHVEFPCDTFDPPAR